MTELAVEKTPPPAVAAPARSSPWWILAAVVVAGLAVAPLFLAPFATTTLTRIVVFALLAMSLDLLVGRTGLPSLGHAAYFGAGAYAAGWVSIHWTAAAPVPVLAGAAVGALFAAATGWVVVRVGGVYFLMLTLAIGELLAQLAHVWESVTGGANGLSAIPATRLGGTALLNVAYLYWYVLGVALVGAAVLWAIYRSSFGTALRGIRDNEPRMRSLAYPTRLYKYAAFVVAGAVAGVAGALLAAQQRLVTPTELGFTTAATVLLAVVIGGAGSLWGAAVGAALVILVRDALGPALDGHGELLLGVVFIVVVYLLPRGAAGLATVRLRRRP
ncbi:branched-chain amino acid ABC transporter permease [Cryptosporangium aurantiacum]|uniref:Amino acid/amide ABC transporter membrane protein 2, HAAT family n=1 Tax=Cryptosporangium aurantiacum TaxID=134849 RepID=A0A1M7R0Y3_9ACTN|nr:branched-chain amino acid ABC transporter permease [Cryptosporangium aurantiacum]SHN38204.1 amino acid/amide ABC transporter membrane protein 2, HAAT family [Cryptosporangium aurantiacum]